MKVDIIGAGIGGLTTAIALEQKGFKPTLYEQAQVLKPVGAGIVLASNAMNVYRKLGLEQQLKEVGTPIEALNVRDNNLKILSGMNLSIFKRKYGLQSLAIHRGKLQEVLLANLKHTTLRLGHKVSRMDLSSDGYNVHFQNGDSIQSMLLIGADGTYSTVRGCLFPNSKIRKTNQVCWRGVTNFELPKRFQSELNELWGKGDRFGFTNIGNGKVYWFALKTFTSDEKEYADDQLVKYYQDYPTVVREILAATPLSTLHTTVLADLEPIPVWYNEFACLIGDAAHATTPNMGQGACQSIEDAVALVECLAEAPNADAFSNFQERRIAKAHQVVNQSWQIGKLAHWQNPVARFFRNTFMKLVPAKLNQVQLEKLFQLDKLA